MAEPASAATRAPHVATADAPVPNWGRLVATGSGTAAWNRRHPDEIAQTIPHHLVLFSFRSFARRETRLGGARIRTAAALGGATEIVPAYADYWARWHEDKEVAAFSLRADWLDRLAQERLGRDRVELCADALPVIDPQVAVLGRMLRDELSRGDDWPFLELKLDAMFQLLGAHLLQFYGQMGRPLPSQKGGLGPRRWRDVRAYLDANVAAPVRLDELASVAGLSPSYFLRAFARETGTTPHRYLVRLRLERTRELLTATKLPLAEVAATAGFASQSHMTNLMRREHGMTPGQVRAGAT